MVVGGDEDYRHPQVLLTDLNTQTWESLHLSSHWINEACEEDGGWGWGGGEGVGEERVWGNNQVNRLVSRQKVIELFKKSVPQSLKTSFFDLKEWYSAHTILRP